MYLIVIGWFYVTLLMALAEAFSPQGTVLGAIITFVLYGLLPLSLVIYIFGTPLRRRARQQENENTPANTPAPDSPIEPNTSGHATRLPEEPTVPAVRKET